MNTFEAMVWLDDNGGKWSVRATAQTCAVVAAVGAVRVVVPTTRLGPKQVDDALVDAVEELQGALGSGAG